MPLGSGSERHSDKMTRFVTLARRVTLAQRQNDTVRHFVMVCYTLLCQNDALRHFVAVPKRRTVLFYRWVILSQIHVLKPNTNMLKANKIYKWLFKQNHPNKKFTIKAKDISES